MSTATVPGPTRTGKTTRWARATPTARARPPPNWRPPATATRSWPRRAWAWARAAPAMGPAGSRASFRAARGGAVATARAGNVIGGGDWAQDRLLPDAMRAWSQGQPLRIRRRQATRPWQHVLEALAAYLRLAQRLWEQPALAGAYNFGPLPQAAVSVGNLIESAAGDCPACAIDYGNE